MLACAATPIAVEDGVSNGAPHAILWHDPGPVGRLDMAGGAGGKAMRPAPPFTFLVELSGTSVKLKVGDARGRHWVVKWGSEVKSETLASRIAWACGY